MEDAERRLEACASDARDSLAELKQVKLECRESGLYQPGIGYKAFPEVNYLILSLDVTDHTGF